MRHLPLVLLAACAPPPGGVASLDDTVPLGAELPVDRAPAPADYQLTADNFVAGEAATLYVDGAPDFALVRVMVGMDGMAPGPCPAAFGGPCLGVARPARLLRWAIRADSFGSGSLTVIVPPNMAGRYATFQTGIAGAPGSLSNVVGRFIGAAGTVVTPGDDLDGDGYAAPEDCADFRADVAPGVPDSVGDRVDRNCDDHDGTDADGDGLESEASGGPDCDDADDAVGDQPDVCDGRDNDCDGLVDPDCEPTSCRTIDEASGFTAASGLYSVDLDGGDPVNAIQVYCDMDTDGGGWTRVVNIRPGTNAHGSTTGAYGDVANGGIAAKLSDAQINQLSTVGFWRYDCGGYHARVRNVSNTWVSQTVNGEDWSVDRGSDGTFECAANRSGYVFSDHPACDAGHSNYAATSLAEGGGCYHVGEGWNLSGALWAK